MLFCLSNTHMADPGPCMNEGEKLGIREQQYEFGDPRVRSIERKMMTLAPLPLPLLGFPHHPPTPNLVFYPHSSSTRNSRKFPNRTLSVFGLNSKDPKESLLFDDNGAVDDMEGYLNQLSLEYDSVWDTKPSWCQPWTITLTGVSIIATSWLILRSVPATSIISLLICAWWYTFLYSYPKAYSEMIAERRERVTSGAEDTFGRKQKQ